MKWYQITFIFFLISEVELSTKIVVDKDFCAPTRSKNVIEGQINWKQSYTCMGADYTSQIVNNIPYDVEELAIINSNIYEEDFEEEGLDGNKFDALNSIKIIQSFIGPALLEWMESLKHLQTLSLLEVGNGYTTGSDANNWTIIDLKLTSFNSLQRLQLSGVNITNLEVKNLDTVPYLDLSDNHFDCGHDFVWLIRLYKKKKKVALNNNNICFMKKLFNNALSYPPSYSLAGKPLLPILEYKREAVDNCPPKCSCELTGVVTVRRPQLNVYCIGLNMTKLPDVMPKGTSGFNFSYNLIEDLTPLYTNSIYDTASMLVLSHNHISFLDPVQFPDFLKKRRDIGFWLDHNRLKKFPAEAVKKALDEALENPGRYFPKLVIGHNPWVCSCDYILQFQDLIHRNMYDIEPRDIRCSEGDELNAKSLVITLDIRSFCKNDSINTLDILNILLALLLLVLLANFIHNYRKYKKDRTLPWIVKKFKC